MTTTPAEGRAGPRRRKTPGAWVAFALAFVALLGLGTWQVYRLQWKTALIAEREAQLALPPVEIADVRNIGDAAALGFRRARARGVFLHDRELYLAATRAGKVGFDVITPLRLMADGGTLLVDRGWVPAALRAPEKRAAGQVAGPVTVAGVLRKAERKRWLVPDNDPARNTWFWRDLAAMAEAAGVDAPPVLLEAGPAPNPGGWPKGRKPVVDLPNNHLGYAITWYLLAIALAVVFAVWRRQQVDDGAGAPGRP